MKEEFQNPLEQNHVREDFCSTVVSGGAHSKATNDAFALSGT